ncbi:MAG TPA: RNB domain-containing ribonuclease [Anaerolineaceae bacterium]
MEKPNGLYLYKNRPARLLRVTDDRLEIELESGETARVRSKDVIPLHPGPIISLSALKTPVVESAQETAVAWEILAGSTTTLKELAELIYGYFTPVTAWATWREVVEGDYFDGEPDAIRVRTAEEVARRKAERERAEASQRAWQEFLERARRRALLPEDRDYLRDVELLAYGRAQRSAVLRALGRSETPENAHALLLELGIWTEQVDPYPARMGAPRTSPELPVPPLPDEDRRDLTGLPAFAIDDQGTDTPDDAISLDEVGGKFRLWVHVADVAALVDVDSPLDIEARSRGESLHLPEGTVHLLPRAVTLQLGLGMQPVSPALSFGISLGADGLATALEIVPSWVRVTRLSYDEANLRMDAAPFSEMARLTDAARSQRREAGAVMIDFPEVRIEIDNGQVSLRPLPPLRSRLMVEEAMILAGTEVARFAAAHGIRLPFSQQDPPESSERPETLSGMFALRRTLKRSQYRVSPGAHNGLAVPAYTQVTSPLRRYLDLVGHQQLRAFLRGSAALDESQLVERIGAVEAVIGSLRQAEFLAEKHWTLVYLLQHPGWRGEGILAEKRGANGTVLIPALALETHIHLGRDLPLDQPVQVALAAVNLPQLEARFQLAG